VCEGQGLNFLPGTVVVHVTGRVCNFRFSSYLGLCLLGLAWKVIVFRHQA
jgi:hypothetical protein